MPRRTENDAEALHLTEMANALLEFMIVELTLINGVKIEGVKRRSPVGNNGGQDGYWRYYGSIELQGIDGQTYDVDMLDIRSVDDRWSARNQAYEEAGLIKLV